MRIRLTSQALRAPQKTNWPKRAAFTLPVVIGLVFCIPPLLRATVGDADEVVALPDDPGRDASRETASDRSATQPVRIVNRDSAAILSPRSGTAAVLTATILGKTRRGAIINGRLRREGDRILVADELFRLVHVAADRIELVRDGKDSAAAPHMTIRLLSEHDSTK